MVDPQRGQEEQSGKSGSTEGRRADAKGLPEQGKIPERTTLGSFARKVECGSSRAGTQHTRTGS